MNLFSQIKKQNQAVQFLKSALRNRRLPSTLLFVGQDEAVKKQCALAVLQALVCDHSEKTPDDPCGRCPACVRVARAESESLVEVSPQGANIKIEQVRTLMKEVSLQNTAKARAVLFEKAQLMTPQSANALLKTLEEAPEQTWFFLLVPSVSSVLSTIRSRSQIIYFLDHSRDDYLQQAENEEWVSRRQKAFQFWLSPTAAEALSQVSEVLQSREASLEVVRFWLELLRDSFYQRHQLPSFIHSDCPTQVTQMTERFSHRLEELSELTLELERSLQQNADYQLAFENFARNGVYANI